MATAHQHTTGATRAATSKRKAANVSLPAEQLAAAKELGVNVSRACSEGLGAAIKRERERRWLEENREAIEERARYVEEHGLPLASERMFPI